MRIIFFAGKGGVGKTSEAAATGIRAAEMGKRTVVMNRLLPDDVTDDYFRAWRENQKRYFEKAEDYFHLCAHLSREPFQGRNPRV